MNILQEINGNLAIFREYNPQSSGIFDLPKRTDSLSIDISPFACETDLDRESYINYFGNLLYYKHKPIKNNEWSNVKDLYKIIEKISFGDSGVLDTGNFKSYLQEGYALIDCPGCVSKLKFDSSNSDSEYLKGSIDIEYNSFKILKDDNVILDKKIGTGDLIFNDFINFKKSDSDVYKYKKQIFDGAIISGSGINFLQEKPFYWEDVDLNSKFITPISYDDSINDKLTGQINVSIFSGKTISGYAVLPNLIKEYNKISGDKILSDVSYLPIKEYSREIFLSLYSGLEAYEYQKENSNFIPRMQRAYDPDEGIYKNRPSTYRITKENTFLPAKDEKHILLFDIDLYGFSGEAPEECDAELNAYILDEGNFSEIVKNPIPLNLTVTDLKTELTGLIRNVNDILKEKDVISGYQLNTNVSYDNSFFKYNKKYPYEVIKMKVELTSPKKTCYNIPQFFVLKDQNLSNFNRLRSYSLQVKDLNNNKIITSGVFVSGIQEGFLVNLNAGKYEFILSGTEKKFVNNEIYQNISIDNLEVLPEDPSNNTDNEVGDNNGEVSYDCHPILIRLTNADDVYEGQITNPINAKNAYIRINGFDTLNNDTATRASYYQLSLNENYINLIEPNYLFSGDKNSTYRVKMRSICSECQPIQMTINNGNTIYSGNIPEYITAKNKVMYISGYNFGGGIIQPNSYELYVNGNIISLNSPSYVLTGSLNKNYKIKMRGVCNIQESSASLNSSSSSSSSRNSVSSSSSISLADDQLGNCLDPLDPCNQNGQFTIFPILNVTKSLCDNLGGRFELGEYPLPICYFDPSSSSSRSSSSRSSSSRSSSSVSSSSRSSSSRSSSSRSSSSSSSAYIFRPPTISSSISNQSSSISNQSSSISNQSSDDIINLQKLICEMSLSSSSEESCSSGCANTLNDFGIRFSVVTEEVECGNNLSQPRKSIKIDSRIKFYADNLNNYGGCGNQFDGSKDYDQQIYFKGYDAVPCDLEKVLPYSKYPRMQNALSKWVRQPYDENGVGQMYRLAGCKKISNIHNVNNSSCLEQFRDNGNLDLSASMDIFSLNPWVVFFPFITVHLDSPDGEIIHEKGWISKGGFAYQYQWDGDAVNRYIDYSLGNNQIISSVKDINFCNTRNTDQEFHVAINTPNWITSPFDGKNCDNPSKIFVKIKLKVANIKLDVSDKVVSLYNSDLGAYLYRDYPNIGKTWGQLVDSEIPDFIHELKSPTNLNDCCGSSSSSRSSGSISSNSLSSNSLSSNSLSSNSLSSSDSSSSSNPCAFGINSQLLGGGCNNGVCTPGIPLTHGSICQLYKWLLAESCPERFFKFDNFELKGLACKQAGDPRCCTTEGGCLFASISYDVEPIESGSGWNIMDVYDYVQTQCDMLAWERIDGNRTDHKTCSQLKTELYQKFQNLKVTMVDIQIAIADGIGMQKFDDIDTNFIPMNRKIRRSIIIDLRGKGYGMNICGSPTVAGLTLACGSGSKFTTIGIAGTQTSGCDCPSCCRQDGFLLGGLPSCSSSSNSSISSSSSCLVVFLDCFPNGYKVCPQTLVPRCSDTDIPPCYCVPCGYPTSCPAGYTLRVVGTDVNGCTIRVCKPNKSYSTTTNTVISKILNIYKTKL
jgi:hypothetical protein